MAYNSEEITGEETLRSKSTALKNMAKSYEKRVSGWGWNQNDNSWEIKGPALAGSQLIQDSTSIILSFCETANLITTKDELRFKAQFFDAFHRINAMCTNSRQVFQERYRAFIKIFKDTMQNVGDIIVGSRKLIREWELEMAQEKATTGEY